MASTWTTNKHIEKPANGDDVNTWSTPVNADWDLIDTAFGGITTLNAAGASGTVSVTQLQCTPPFIYITGLPVGNIIYQTPAGVGGVFVVWNNTTGPYSITFETANLGTTVVIPQGKRVAIITDGTNVLLQNTTPPAPAGSDTEVQFNSGGALAANSNLTFDGTNLTVGGALTLGAGLAIGGSVTSSLNVTANAQTAPATVTFSATAMALNCSLSNVFFAIFTANVTVAPAVSNPHDGQTINWFIVQDATGSRTMTWPVAFKWPGGVAGVLSTAPNAVDLLVATYLAGTGNWYVTLAKGFA